MKKHNIFAIVLSAMFLASMASCTPDETPVIPDTPTPDTPVTPTNGDGFYDPGKKIHCIYMASTFINKYLSQVWNWNDNTLDIIDHFNTSGGNIYTENFTYDDKRLIRVDDFRNSRYITYEYDGEYLKIADSYSKDKLNRSIAYTYDEGKLSQMEITYYDYDKSEKQGDFIVLTTPFNAEVCASMEKFADKVVADKGIQIITVQCTWDGHNITRVRCSYEDQVILYMMTYDAKKNPFKGFLNINNDGNNSEDVVGFYSKNNVVTVMVYGDEMTILNYTYVYDNDNYPTIVTYSEEDSDHSVSIFYEYVVN